MCKEKNSKDYVIGTIIKIIDEEDGLYFILKYDYLRYIWVLDVSKYDIYIRNQEKIFEENRKKENLWKLYKEGYIEILDKPKNN